MTRKHRRNDKRSKTAGASNTNLIKRQFNHLLHLLRRNAFNDTLSPLEDQIFLDYIRKKDKIVETKRYILDIIEKADCYKTEGVYGVVLATLNEVEHAEVLGNKRGEGTLQIGYYMKE